MYSKGLNYSIILTTAQTCEFALNWMFHYMYGIAARRLGIKPADRYIHAPAIVTFCCNKYPLLRRQRSTVC